MRDLRATLDQLTADASSFVAFFIVLVNSILINYETCRSELLSPASTTVPSQFILYDSESKTTITSKASYLGDEDQVLISAQDEFEKYVDTSDSYTFLTI